MRKSELPILQHFQERTWSRVRIVLFLVPQGHNIHRFSMLPWQQNTRCSGVNFFFFNGTKWPKLWVCIPPCPPRIHVLLQADSAPQADYGVLNWTLSMHVSHFRALVTWDFQCTTTSYIPSSNNHLNKKWQRGGLGVLKRQVEVRLMAEHEPLQHWTQQINWIN